jgi:hypothetical protein
MYTKLNVGDKRWMNTNSRKVCTSMSVITTEQFVYSLSVVDNETVFFLIFIFLDHEVDVQAIFEQKTLCFQYKQSLT